MFTVGSNGKKNWGNTFSVHCVYFSFIRVPILQRLNATGGLRFSICSWNNWWCKYKQRAFLSKKQYLDYLIDNIYAELGETLHKQTIGIPMGMSCAPLLAKHFLVSNEGRFM